ncbi:MAG: hypothetical protein U0457_09155 [Candidatus Sericytochromatia bacterium]
MNKHLFESLLYSSDSRRTFLKKSFLGVILLNIAPFFISGCSGYPKSTNRLKVFNNKEEIIMTHIAETFVAPTETGLPSPEKLNLVKEIDEYISTVSDESKNQLKTLLNVFEDYSFFFNGSFKKFTAMNLDEKNKYIESWEKSTIEFRQMAYRALKMCIMMIYYTKDETWEKIGYTGPYCEGTTNK